MWYQCNTVVKISIHALLAESDTSPRSRLRQLCNFYPRSPCGERLGGAREEFAERIFLSTLSLRRATLAMAGYTKAEIISIHALLAESDAGWVERSCKGIIFLSTLSLRRATGLDGRFKL